jgi:hypothetical protein
MSRFISSGGRANLTWGDALSEVVPNTKGRNRETVSLGRIDQIGECSMVDKTKDSRAEVSRRSVLLQGALCATGVAAVLVANVKSAKAAKLPQTTVAYRAKPKGTKECDNCKFFTAPDSCQKVAGKISPKGFCIIWQKA